MVQARWRRAQQLAKDGDPAEALMELLWCYDVGMVQISGMSAVRNSFAVVVLAKLGERYPAALDALRERRDRAREQVLASESDYAVAQQFGSLNHALKDDQATLALYDQLPAGDRRRRTLAFSAYDKLVESRRYAVAIEGRPYSMLSSSFERGIEERPLPAAVTNQEAIRSGQRKVAIDGAAKAIEALAGSGDLDRARTLAQRLLAYDASDATRALIQQHAERAGQPGLLAPVKPP